MNKQNATPPSDRLSSVVRRYSASQSGQAVIEYCLIASLVVLFVMAGAGGNASPLSSPLDRIVIAITSNAGGQGTVKSTTFENDLPD